MVSKVFEKLVNNTIVDHLEKCGLFSGFQYGFRSSQSTTDLLTVVSDRINRAFKRFGATRAVALDISKAFYRVWHTGLLHKLKLYGMCDQAFDLGQQLELASELESDLPDTVFWGRKWLIDFNAGKTQLLSFDWSNKTGAIDVKMKGSVLEQKSSFKIQGLTFSSELDWGSCIISIVGGASKRVRALIGSMKFLSPKIALYLCKSAIQPCMESMPLLATWNC